MSAENIEFNVDNLDTTEFWKSRDESTKLTLNEQLLRIARDGPCSEFISLLERASCSSPMSRDGMYAIDLDISDNSGWTPLIHASFNGHLAIVEHIISYQEQKYMKQYSDELIVSTLSTVEQSTNGNGNGSADPNDDTLESSTISDEIEGNLTQSTNTATNGNHEKSELKWEYLFKQFLVCKVKWNGSTALHLACARGHESIAKLLINKMVNEYSMAVEECVNARDYDMATPLHCAVLGKHYSICKLLLINGCSVSKYDNCGKTPFDWAKERNLTEYISLLSQYANEEQNGVQSVANKNAKSSADTEKVQVTVQSIWDTIQDECHMSESKLSENDIINGQNVIGSNNHHSFNTYTPSPNAPNTHTYPINNNNKYIVGPENNIIRNSLPLPPYQNNQWSHYRTHNIPNTHMPPQQRHSFQSHNHHYHSRQRAPRHQRYRDSINSMNSYNNSCHSYNQTQSPIVSPESAPTMPPPPGTLTASRSCPTPEKERFVNKTMGNENKTDLVQCESSKDENSDKNESEQAESEKSEVTNFVCNDDPAVDAMKFQNKYLKARVRTLEKEHKELATEYKQQLMKERNRMKTKEDTLLHSLDEKQTQIHELRHTLRRMRMYLDNLPVKMRRNFYRNNCNSERINTDESVNQNSFKSKLTNNKECHSDNEHKSGDITVSKNVSSKGRKTDEIMSQKQNPQNKSKNKNKNKFKNKKNNGKSYRREDTFLFSKLPSNAARSRKCAMSDKSWRKKSTNKN